MCVAVPGKVMKIEDGVAEVDFSGNLVRAMTGLVNVKVGDYALVHAGCIIQIMKPKEALEIQALFEEVQNEWDK